MDLFCSFVRVNLFSDKATLLSFAFGLSFSFLSVSIIIHTFATLNHLCCYHFHFYSNTKYLFCRYQEKWFCKCIISCTQYQEVAETVSLTIGRKTFIWKDMFVLIIQIANTILNMEHCPFAHLISFFQSFPSQYLQRTMITFFQGSFSIIIKIKVQGNLLTYLYKSKASWIKH